MSMGPYVYCSLSFSLSLSVCVCTRDWLSVSMEKEKKIIITLIIQCCHSLCAHAALISNSNQIVELVIVEFNRISCLNSDEIIKVKVIALNRTTALIQFIVAVVVAVVVVLLLIFSLHFSLYLFTFEFKWIFYRSVAFFFAKYVMHILQIMLNSLFFFCLFLSSISFSTTD